MNDRRRLIIIAGPSAVGKSTLIERLRNEELPSISTRLATGTLASWEFWNANELERFSDLSSYRAFVHYDFRDEHEDERRALRMLEATDDVAFLTLWEAPSVLLQRSNQRVWQLLPRLFKKGKFRQVVERLRDLEKKRYLYKHPPELWRRYSEWLEFCASYDARAHLVVRSTRPDAPVELANLKCPHLRSHGRSGTG